MNEILNMLRKIIVHTTIHIVATGCNSHSWDRFVLLPDRKNQILWMPVIKPPNAHEVNKWQGQGSDCFNQRPKDTQVLWKPATQHVYNTNSVLMSFLIGLHHQWILLQSVGQMVVKDVVIHWCWGGMALSVWGALRGEDNGCKRCSWWYVMCK